MGLFEESYLHP
nr:unnamed protein product [Callosobruchus chinensis]